MTTAGASRPRTVLEYLLHTRDQTHDEISADFTAVARLLGENATLSPRHLRRLLSGERTSASPQTRRILQELFGHPFAFLMKPWSETMEAEHAGILTSGSPTLIRNDATQAIEQAFVRVQSSAGNVGLENRSDQSLSDEVMTAWQARQQRFTTRPHLVAIGGYAGSGKSEFGRFICSITGWPLLDKDVLTRPLVESLLASFGSEPNDRESSAYRTRVRPLEYQCLMNAAYENLECGISTIVAAPFIEEFDDARWLQRLTNRCHALGTTVSIAWVTCDSDSMHEYLSARGAARDAWKLANWGEWLAEIDLGKRPACAYVHIDNQLNAAVSLADQARALVRQFSR